MELLYVFLGFEILLIIGVTVFFFRKIHKTLGKK